MNRPVNPTEEFLTLHSFPEIARELRQGEAYARVGKNSRSLVKSPQLSMVLLALGRGAALKDHHAPAPATAVVLEGRIAFTSALGSRELGRLENAVFSAELEHGVEALEESLLLLIIGGKG